MVEKVMNRKDSRSWDLHANISPFPQKAFETKARGLSFSRDLKRGNPTSQVLICHTCGRSVPFTETCVIDHLPWPTRFTRAVGPKPLLPIDVPSSEIYISQKIIALFFIFFLFSNMTIIYQRTITNSYVSITELNNQFKNLSDHSKQSLLSKQCLARRWKPHLNLQDKNQT